MTADAASDARAAPGCLWPATAALAIGLRWAYWPWMSADYWSDWRVWYEHFAARGFAALGDRF